MLKYVYIALGLVTLTLGLLGIITPGLPTTPLLLLTAFLFAKGSKRLHQKLLENKITGYYINKVNKGLSLKARLISIGLMWCMVSFSAIVIFNGTMRYVMLGLGVIGTIAQIIIFSKKPLKTSVKFETEENADPFCPTCKPGPDNTDIFA